MAHALALGRRLAGDIRGDGFGDMRLNIFRRFFFTRSADFAHHHDGFGRRVVLKHFQAINKIQTFDWVATDADAGALAQIQTRGLMYRFIGQGAGARHDADFAGLMDEAGHDADFAFAGGDDAGAIRADEFRAISLQSRFDFQHVQYRNTLGDTHDDFDARIRCLHDGIGGIRRRHINHAGIGASR